MNRPVISVRIDGGYIEKLVFASIEDAKRFIYFARIYRLEVRANVGCNDYLTCCRESFDWTDAVASTCLEAPRLQRMFDAIVEARQGLPPGSSSRLALFTFGNDNDGLTFIGPDLPSRQRPYAGDMARFIAMDTTDEEREMGDVIVLRDYGAVLVVISAHQVDRRDPRYSPQPKQLVVEPQRVMRIYNHASAAILARR